MPIIINSLTALRLAFKANYAQMVTGSFMLVALGILLSAYFGGRQPTTVALDVGFSIIRFLLPIMIVLLAQELLSREFDKRYYFYSLSYPHARYNLLLGRFTAMLVLVLGALVALSLLQLGLVHFIGSTRPQATPVALGQPYLIVVAFIALDLILLTAVATLLAVVASTTSFVLVGTLGFMMVARSYSAIVELLTYQAGLVSNTEDYRTGLGVLNYLLPDLGALDIRMLALYGKPEFLPNDWPWLIMSNLTYAVALLALAVWALQRKRFA